MVNKIPVEVAYATPAKQVVIQVLVDASSTVQQAIEQSGILKQFPEIDLSKNTVGIFSQTVELTTQIKANERIEIYRPLTIDPKTRRRIRADR